MRRLIPRGTWVVPILAVIWLLAQPGVDAAAKKKRVEPPPPKIEEVVGDLAFVTQGGDLRVEGVGLVTGLENTGADPPPSWYRTQLVDEMSKAGVEHASKLLGNPQFSMVIVRMTIPTGANPQDRLDVEVEVPPACGTKSLAGGYLMATRLREVMVAGGAPRTGPEVAIAQGPIMLGSARNPSDPKSGRVLGGGRVKKDFPYTLVLKENRRSVRTAAIVEKVVNERFHQSDGGRQKGVATAKTDSVLVLKVPPRYHQNQERFLRVVQLLPVIDTPELRVQRTAAWGQELLDPRTGGVAALKLEGLGLSAAEALQGGLQSDHAQVRFFAAEALAYLDEPAGAEILAQTAVSMPAFRAYALAALASMEQPAAHMQLRKLMDEPEMEVRYGAFNALRTFDPRDPALGQVRVLDDDPAEEESAIEDATDMMAIALRSRRVRPDDPFALYLVDSEGPPVIHVSRTRRSEIVIFGRGQQLLPPVVLGTGAILVNAAENDDQVEISKIVPSRFGDADVKQRSSLDLAEIIRRAANLGATYPEIVTILEAADRQKNLPGTLVVDMVPTANLDYLQAAILGKDSTAKADPEVRPATANSSSSRWRRIFGFLNRDHEEPARTVQRGENTAASGGAMENRGGANPDRNEPSQLPLLATEGGSTGHQDPAGINQGGNPTAKGPSDPAGKRDDALRKAGAGEEAGVRPRRFSLLRRRSE